MNVNLNKKSWHSNLYDKLYEEDLPDNLCPYFWKIIFALITLPFWCITHKGSFSAFEKVFFGFLIESFTFLFGLIFASIYVDVLNTEIIWLYYLFPIAGVLIPVTLFFIFVVIVLVTSLLGEKWKNRKSGESSSLFKAKVHAVKNKICPKINWK